jgi:hypothetical protein
MPSPSPPPPLLAFSYQAGARVQTHH